MVSDTDADDTAAEAADRTGNELYFAGDGDPDRIRRPWAIPASITGEARVHVGAGGVSLRTLDAAKVCQASLNIYPEAFESYTTDAAGPLGVSIADLTDKLERARYGNRYDDSVSIVLDAGGHTVTVVREYDSGVSGRFTADVEGFDYESVREPDTLAEETNVDFDGDDFNHGSIDPTAFADALDFLDDAAPEKTGAFEMGVNGSVLVLSDAKTDPSVSFAGAVDDNDDPGGSVWLSPDYLTDIAGAFKTARVDEVRFAHRADYPTRFTGRRTDADGTVLYEATMALAPRLKPDSDGLGDD